MEKKKKKKLNLTISLTLKLNNPPDLTTFNTTLISTLLHLFPEKNTKKKVGARHGDESDSVAILDRSGCARRVGSTVGHDGDTIRGEGRERLGSRVRIEGRPIAEV